MHWTWNHINLSVDDLKKKKNAIKVLNALVIFILSVILLWCLLSYKRKDVCHQESGQNKEFNCLIVVVYHLPGKGCYQCDIHNMADSQKKKAEMTKSFQNTLIWVQRLVRPFPLESLAALCKWPALTFGLPFCAALRVEPLSYVRGAWTAAKPVRGSSYFDTLKHLPSLKHGRERHRENNRERASFQPLLTGWSSTDCLSLKSIKGQCSSLYPPTLQKDTP